ncbi:hypothetical protein SAMN06295967_1284 [Belliella buryatensis]|uniref:Uncharacterized protein n=1 Tax=Belliella buryatensis TaxID=1500549 RepID=A0A239H868_9BACT|nr:hypothetical protein [Belliella buryatensis]SNS77361.1 hypothetical protein SAMN06295967_1284 [Belliella buryatensis]
MAIIKHTIVDWESVEKSNSPVLSAFFELNDKEVTMSKYYYNNFKRIQTLFIFSIENKPSLIIDCKYDYGKTFREVNLNLGYLESSTKPIGLLYHDSALIINSLEHTKIILIENPSLMNGFSDFFSDLFIFKINQIKK